MALLNEIIIAENTLKTKGTLGVASMIHRLKNAEELLRSLLESASLDPSTKERVKKFLEIS